MGQPVGLATSGSGASGVSGALGVPAGKGRVFSVAAAAVLAVGLGGLAFGIYSRLGGRGEAATAHPAADLKASVLMSGSDFGIQSGSGPNSTGGAVLSADGRYLAYTTVKEGRGSLNVRQIRTGSEVEIVPFQPGFVTRPWVAVGSTRR